MDDDGVPEPHAGGKYAGFLAVSEQLSATTEGPAKGKKRRRQEEASADGATEHEQVPRKSHPEWSRGVAGRLPLKLPDGSFAAAAARPVQPKSDPSHAQGEEEGEEGEEGEEEEGGALSDSDEEDAGGSDTETRLPRTKKPARPDADVTTYKQLSALSPSALADRRQRKTAQIAECSERLVAAPEHNVSASSTRAVTAARAFASNFRGRGRGRGGGSAGRKDEEGDAPGLKRNTLLILHGLGADPDPVIRKLALLSLTTVFRDILPGYRIRLPSSAEAASAVSKEVKKLRNFEGALLTGYQRFLRLLEHTVIMGERAGKRIKAQVSAAGEGEGEGGSTRGGAFEADARQEENPWDDGPEGGKKNKHNQHGISAKDYAASKMADKRASKAARDGLGPYDGDSGSKVVLGATALRCMGQLLAALPHFNFTANVAAFVVPRMSSKDDDSASIACEAVAHAFANDTTFECALEITRVLADEAKASASGKGPPRLRAQALQTLTRLRLTDLEKLDSLNRDGKVDQAERNRDRKRAKTAAKLAKFADKGPDIVAGLKAADAENLADRKKFAQATLKRVIAIFFRVLRSPSHAFLLPETLAGLARFAHLIDVSIVSDLLVSLKETLVNAMGGDLSVDAGDEGGAATPTVHLSLPSALNSILTALRIIAGPGSVLNADDTQFAHFLYSALLRVCGSGGAPHALTAVYAVQALLVNRREYSPDRVAAFVKRCLTVSLSLPVPSCLAMLSVVRSICAVYPQARGVCGPPTGVGGAAMGGGGGGLLVGNDVTLGVAGGLHAACTNPDKAGLSLHLTGWEIAPLLQHWHPAVRDAAGALAQHRPVLPSDAPSAVARSYGEESGLFNPPPTAPRTAGGTPHAAPGKDGKVKMKFAYDKVVPPVIAGVVVGGGGGEGAAGDAVTTAACEDLGADKVGRLFARTQLFVQNAARMQGSGEWRA